MQPGGRISGVPHAFLQLRQVPKYSMVLEKPVNTSLVPTAMSELPWKKTTGLFFTKTASELLPP